jgi:hypothetical protein
MELRTPKKFEVRSSKFETESWAPLPDTGVFSQGTVLSNRRSAIRNRKSIQGQVLLYLVGVLGVLGLTALWLLDSNTAIVSRIRAQNGADAAALAAAQWQGRSLNALGEINLVKAIATLLVDVPPGQGLQARLAAAPPEQAFATIQQALTELQAEIRFVGPILAFVAAQQGAKNNAVPVNESYTSAVAGHAALVESTYADAFSGGEWPSADWNRVYAAMLHYVADNGVAAAADNAQFYGSRLSAGALASTYLLNRGFYYAIAGRNWCSLRALLQGGYQDYTIWGPVTVLPQDVFGSEYFGLGVSLAPLPSGTPSSQITSLQSYFQTELTRRGLALSPTNFTELATNLTWAVYNSSSWGPWDKAVTYRDALLADPRPQHNYSGCDAVTAVTIPNQVSLALTNRGSGWTSWLVGSGGQAATAQSVARLETLNASGAFGVRALAAAKPFGSLSGSTDPAYQLGIVLPVYNEVRLIPIALASAYGNSDAQWLNHRVYHLPSYTQQGLAGLDANCFYCEQLRTLEDAAFRQEGNDWLTATNPITGQLLHPCVQRGGGGGGGTGGVPYAH